MGVPLSHLNCDWTAVCDLVIDWTGCGSSLHPGFLLCPDWEPWPLKTALAKSVILMETWMSRISQCNEEGLALCCSSEESDSSHTGQSCAENALQTSLGSSHRTALWDECQDYITQHSSVKINFHPVYSDPGKKHSTALILDSLPGLPSCWPNIILPPTSLLWIISSLPTQPPLFL